MGTRHPLALEQELRGHALRTRQLADQAGVEGHPAAARLDAFAGELLRTLRLTTAERNRQPHFRRPAP